MLPLAFALRPGRWESSGPTSYFGFLLIGLFFPYDFTPLTVNPAIKVFSKLRLDDCWFSGRFQTKGIVGDVFIQLHTGVVCQPVVA